MHQTQRSKKYKISQINTYVCMSQRRIFFKNLVPKDRGNHSLSSSTDNSILKSVSLTPLWFCAPHIMLHSPDYTLFINQLYKPGIEGS